MLVENLVVVKNGDRYECLRNKYGFQRLERGGVMRGRSACVDHELVAC